MSSNPKATERTVDGGSTDQHVTGADETGEFPTDRPPTTTTPANGSSNIGINTNRGNRADVDDPDTSDAP